MFSPLLAVACVCILVSLILYFFYWNRFIAFLIGQAIRVLYWNQEASSIWVEIGMWLYGMPHIWLTNEPLGSIHFSLISGRILLKDVKYHSSNQTIRVLKGQIQWRYWIRNPTAEDELHANGVDGEYEDHVTPHLH